MCGRYTLTTLDGPALAASLGVRGPEPFEQATLGRFNVCPTESVAAVCGDGGERVVRTMRWGLVRPRTRGGRGAPPPLINARGETVAARRPFAMLLPRADRRCLVVADGWYEWLRSERGDGERVPFRYTLAGGAPFAFAGLWDVRHVAGEPVACAAILTTAANPVCAPVHDRMPCVLAGPEEQAAWLGDVSNPTDLAELLTPLPPELTAVAPANPAVNRAGVEGPELLEAPPARPEPEAQLGLGI